jgi:hypothetical protein
LGRSSALPGLCHNNIIPRFWVIIPFTLKNVHTLRSVSVAVQPETARRILQVFAGCRRSTFFYRNLLILFDHRFCSLALSSDSYGQGILLPIQFFLNNKPYDMIVNNLFLHLCSMQ